MIYLGLAVFAVYQAFPRHATDPGCGRSPGGSWCRCCSTRRGSESSRRGSCH
ncbi:hypothetical protein NKG05_20465 [Oerskovia sp. M15]